MKNIYGRILVALVFCAAILVFAENGFSQTSNQSIQEYKRQKLILGHLEPAEKVALWKQHLHKQLETRSFTKGQLGVIKKALALLKEDFYRVDSATVRRQQSDPHSARAIFEKELGANFSKEEAAAIFYKIDSLILNAYVSSKPILVQVKLTEGGNCDCLNNDNCCGMTCINLGTCLPIQACGLMGGQDCTGKCGASEGN